MKTFRMYAIFLFLVIASGCIGTSAASFDVLVFNQLGFSESSVTDKDIIDFFYEVQNKGAKEITFAKVFFFGIPHKYDVQLLTATSPLLPPTESGAQGDRYANSFTLDMYPNFSLPQGTSQTYDLQVRLIYKYSAEANSVFNAMTRDTYIAERQRGNTPKAKPILLQSLPGPIQVSIRTEQPVVFYKEGEQQKAKVLFVIENRGGGIPLAMFDEASNVSTFSLESTNRIGNMTIYLDGSTAQQCTDGPIALFNNRAEVSCDIIITKPFTEQQYRLEVEIPYYYVVDQKASFTVEGTRVDDE